MMSVTRKLVNSNLSPDSVAPLSVVLLKDERVKQEAPKRQHGAEVYPRYAYKISRYPKYSVVSEEADTSRRKVATVQRAHARRLELAPSSEQLSRES